VKRNRLVLMSYNDFAEGEVALLDEGKNRARGTYPLTRK
jgi:hypothetical protein